MAFCWTYGLESDSETEASPVFTNFMRSSLFAVL